jgi:hypothetical protein
VIAYPQSPSATRPFGEAAAAAPATVKPLTVAPERSPVADWPLVRPSERLVTVPIVTSPPKSDTELTWLDADALAFVPTSVEAEAVSDPVVTIDPSLGYEKPPANPTLFGGAETDVDDPPACPGTTTLIAYALAVAPASEACRVAPAGPTTSRSTAARERANESRMGNRWIMRKAAAPSLQTI